MPMVQKLPASSDISPGLMDLTKTCTFAQEPGKPKAVNICPHPTQLLPFQLCVPRVVKEA
eukprot:1157817-Pelagomonas_calceolata.AAC.20